MVSMLELGSVVPAMSSQPQAAKRRRVRAFLLSDRIDTANLEHNGVVSTAPVTYNSARTVLSLCFVTASR
jgi:hypothetical protein